MNLFKKVINEFKNDIIKELSNYALTNDRSILFTLAWGITGGLLLLAGLILVIYQMTTYLASHFEIVITLFNMLSILAPIIGFYLCVCIILHIVSRFCRKKHCIAKASVDTDFTTLKHQLITPPPTQRKPSPLIIERNNFINFVRIKEALEKFSKKNEISVSIL